MTATLIAIQDEVRGLKLDDSLLALNHILSVSRRWSEDPALEVEIGRLQFRPPAYIIHFLAKQMLLHGSNLGIRELDWPTFDRLKHLCIALDDPIQHDPNWKHADPTGFFERILNQQIPSQRRNLIQKYGLALGLFRDSERLEWPVRYDLRADIEKELGCEVGQFMAMAHVCFALRQASWRERTCMGTFTPMLLAEAFSQGVGVCTPEAWTPFLARVACNRDQFRSVCSKRQYSATELIYVPFEFNPLVRYPIIEVAPGHFVAVDPELVIERATFGLFYDLFERDGPAFANRFGHVFDRFVGRLLRSACPVKAVWSAAEWEQVKGKQESSRGKIGDWVYSGDSRHVLIECKSIRPSLPLTTYGLDDDVAKIVERITEALEQLIEHGQAIQAGLWKDAGLMPRPTLCVVVTYGRLQTVNGPFVRKRIRKRLDEKGLAMPVFVVLSLDELDTVIRLVELGHSLDEVIEQAANQDGSFNVLRSHHEDLEKCAVSSLTFNTGESFMRQICPAPEKSH